MGVDKKRAMNRVGSLSKGLGGGERGLTLGGWRLFCGGKTGKGGGGRRGDSNGEPWNRGVGGNIGEFKEKKKPR